MEAIKGKARRRAGAVNGRCGSAFHDLKTAGGQIAREMSGARHLFQCIADLYAFFVQRETKNPRLGLPM